MSRRAVLDAIFGGDPTIAVVGLSPKPWRASFDVAHAMQTRGYRIVPVHPVAAEVLGQKAYRSLNEAAREHRIDGVNIFRRAEEVPAVVEEAIAVGARWVWMQLGIEHEIAAERAHAAGLIVVQDACIKIEHARWLRAGGSTAGR